MKEKNYSEGFKLKEKDIILIGVNFDIEEKNIAGFKIEDYE
ncbi:MAG: hypothetical protein ACOCRO_10315 [Halanaerobiales bacterium]